jgi:voltage-gated potassium channel
VSRRSRLREALNVSALNLVLPRSDTGPGRILARRLLIAVSVLVISTVTVFLQRGGYHDVRGKSLGVIDSLYYATVSLSTTGYGDITPISASARMVNVVVITPLRLLFLIVLVGTTIEVLTATVSHRARARRWRAAVKDHAVIVGYGTKGRAAATALVDAGCTIEQIAVIDLDPAGVAQASDDGATAICGDATRTAVLHQVAVERAARVIIATNRDDTSVLVALTVRQLTKSATVVAAVRHSENASLLRAAGVDAVVVSAEAAGRLLGMSANSPATADLMTDLLDSATGLELIERDAGPADTGRVLEPAEETLLGVVRGGTLGTQGEGEPITVQPGDRLVIVRHVLE